jgi:TP901-1 family phage major tail protein
MASTGILNGTLAKISVAGSTIAHLTSNSLTFDMSTRDASTKDSSGWKESLEGQKSFSGSGEGFFAENASYGYEDLYLVFAARTKVEVIWTTSIAGDMQYKGDCYITSLERTDGLEESTTFSVSFEGTGDVTKEAYTP